LHAKYNIAKNLSRKHRCLSFFVKESHRGAKSVHAKLSADTSEKESAGERKAEPDKPAAKRTK
jgi:hypothetical protein